MDSRQIAVLPINSRSFLRSTTIVTSLPQIVSELVQNSLDAGASQVDVGVDVEQWQCWVRDDGNGIDRTGMSLLAEGSEEGRYGTSKAYNPESLASVSTFGFRGEALASAADVSCLEMSSRTSASRETWSVILKGGKKLYYGAALRWRREKPGTTVCIRDAFYNLPIRRLSHPSPARTLGLIRKGLESLALVFPNVAFSLENNAKGVEVEGGSGRGRILTIPKTSSSLAAFQHLYGRALCEHVHEVDVSLRDMRIQGFISLQGAHSKTISPINFSVGNAAVLKHMPSFIDLVDVNRHLLGPGDLHHAIDSQFAISSFGKYVKPLMKQVVRDQPDPVIIAFVPSLFRFNVDAGLRRSPRKNERRPVYVLNVAVPSRSIDNCLDPAKAVVHFESPDVVSNFVVSVIQSFLLKHGFSSSRSKRKASTESGSPSHHKKRKLEVEVEESKARSAPAASSAPSEKPPPRRCRDRISPTANPTVDALEMQRVDQASGSVGMVGARTVQSTNGDENDSYGDGNCNIRTPRMLVDTTRLRKKLNSSSAEDKVPDWIEQALDGWKNPTFGLREPSVPTLTSLSCFSRRADSQIRLEPARQFNDPSYFFDPNLTAGRKHNAVDGFASFNKAELRDAEVIGQVDKKFIACLVKSESEQAKALVLVDQHAADERIRVERFLSELCRGFLGQDSLCGVEREEIWPHIPILLTRHEARTLSVSEDYRQVFDKWGFRFAQMPTPADPEEDTDDYVQILVESMPKLTGERLFLADELRELVKGFLGKLETEGYRYVAASSHSSNAHWTTGLRWCPKELIDLINSKACRGAIMFNDTLNIEQCQKLIAQLSNTVWPFMCAHGRPSLVPLTNVLGHEEVEGRWAKEIDWRNLDRVTTQGQL